MVDTSRDTAAASRTREAEVALRRLGYARVSPERRLREPDASFWVQEAGVPRRTYPVYVPPGDRATLSDRIDRWLDAGAGSRRRAIFVAPNDAAADELWARLTARVGSTIDHELSILVIPPEARPEEAGHFHRRIASPGEVLRIATGVVVGLFRRAQSPEGAGPVDFEEMLELLKGRFGLDVQRSLNVRSDEDALFVLYQLALRDAYAPGDPGANLHLLVLKPTGPAARLPWFAA
jgi:hypothetical protein